MKAFNRNTLFRECRRRYAGRFEREPKPFAGAVDFLADYFLANPEASEQDAAQAAEADKGISPTTLAIVYMLVTVAWELWKAFLKRKGESEST